MIEEIPGIKKVLENQGLILMELLSGFKLETSSLPRIGASLNNPANISDFCILCKTDVN
jgi:hypothetical protein